MITPGTWSAAWPSIRKPRLGVVDRLAATTAENTMRRRRNPRAEP